MMSYISFEIFLYKEKETEKKLKVSPLLNMDLCAQHGEAKLRNVRVWSRKSFIAEPRKENRQLMLKTPKL